MKRLQRGPQPIIAGVASGLGEYFEIDPVWVRLAFVILALGGGAGFLIYIVLWILMPRHGTYPTVASPNASAFSEDGGSALGEVSSRRQRSPEVIFGGILVVVGLVFLLQNVGWLWWMRWGLAWPVLLILIGIGLLARRLH